VIQAARPLRCGFPRLLRGNILEFQLKASIQAVPLKVFVSTLRFGFEHFLIWNGLPREGFQPTPKKRKESVHIHEIAHAFFDGASLIWFCGTIKLLDRLEDGRRWFLVSFSLLCFFHSVSWPRTFSEPPRTFAMAKENVQVYTRDYSSQVSLNRPMTDPSSNVPAVHPGVWSSEPVPLKSSPLSRWIDRIYDTVLCIAPIGLAIKVGLVIRAHHVDKYAGTGVMNPASDLTNNLINFNDQVRY
jgi:hypothetical protein